MTPEERAKRRQGLSERAAALITQGRGRDAVRLFETAINESVSLDRLPRARPPEPTPSCGPLALDLPTPLTPADRQRLAKAALKADRDAIRDRLKLEAGRMSKATVALVVDTCRQQYDMTSPFRSPARSQVAPIASAGSSLKALFYADLRTGETDPMHERLSPDEVAAAIIVWISNRMQPVTLSRKWLELRIGEGRKGAYRTVELWDVGTARGLVTVPNGLTRFRPRLEPAGDWLTGEEVLNGIDTAEGIIPDDRDWIPDIPNETEW